MLAAFLIGEVIDLEMSEGHKGVVGIWSRQSVGGLSFDLDYVGVVIGKCWAVYDSSRSLLRFRVKGNFEGRLWGVEMVGAIASKPPRQCITSLWQRVREISNREKAELHLLNARGFVDRGSFVFDTG